MKNNPTYEQLFDSGNVHTADPERSVLSPAAYFVDLMRVQEQYIALESPASRPLKNRRPDLWQLLLDDRNTTTMIPKLEIVNRVLRRQLTPDEDLANIDYPFNLPYDEALARIEAYLAQQQTSLAELGQKLALPKASPDARTSALQRLQISSDQWHLYSTPPKTLSELSRYLGFSSRPGSWRRKGTFPMSVAMFLEHTKLTTTELRALLFQDLSATEIDLGRNSKLYINDTGEKDAKGHSLPPISIGAGTETIRVTSVGGSSGSVSIKVGEAEVFDVEHASRAEQGLYVAVIDENTGVVVTRRRYGTGRHTQDVERLTRDLDSLSSGRIIVMAACGYAVAKLAGTSTLATAARAAITKFGSTHVENLTKGDSWALIGQKGGAALGERLRTAGPSTREVHFDLPRAGLCNLTAARLDHINRFARLAEALGWSFSDLDWALRTIGHIVNGGKPTISDAALPYLAWIHTLREKHELSVDQGCALLGRMKDFGERCGPSFFAQIFSNPDVPKPYIHKPSSRYVKDPWRDDHGDRLQWTIRQPAGTNLDPKVQEQNQRIQNALAAALKLGQDDLLTIAWLLVPTRSKTTLTLTLQNLSVLYRASLLPELTGLPMKQVLVAMNFIAPGARKDLFRPSGKAAIKGIKALLDCTRWIESSRFSVFELQLILQGKSEDPAVQNKVLGQDAIINFRQTLDTSLDKILLTKPAFFDALKTDIQQVFSRVAQNRALVSTLAKDDAFVAVLKKENPKRSLDSPQEIRDFLDEKFRKALAHAYPCHQDIAQAVHEELKQHEKLGHGKTSPIYIDAESIVVRAITEANEKQAKADLRAALSRAFTEVILGILLASPPQKIIPSITADLKDALFSHDEPPGDPLVASSIKTLERFYHLQQKTSIEHLAALYHVPSPIGAVLKDWADLNIEVLAGLSSPKKKAGSTVLSLLSFLKGHPATAPKLIATLHKLQQAAELIKGLALSPAEARYFHTDYHPSASFPITLAGVQTMELFARLKHAFQDTQNHLLGILRKTPKTKLTPRLAKLGGWELEQVEFLAKKIFPAAKAQPASRAQPAAKAQPTYTIEDIALIRRYFATAASLGIDVPTLSKLTSATQVTAELADALWAGLQKLYREQPGVLKKLQSRLDEALRDRLVPLVMHKLDLPTPRALYEYLLIDVEVSDVVETSKVKEAISAVQLYIYRCLQHLEPGVHVDPMLGRLWQWMHGYRTWQANREVFLYPESYIQPQLRKNKTDLFAKLESDLGQADLTDPDSVTKVFQGYMNGFAEVAQLKIVGSAARDLSDGAIATKQVAMVGKTKAQHGGYYFRVATFVESAGRYEPTDWGQWQKMEIPIPSITYTVKSSGQSRQVVIEPLVAPVFAFGRWYVLWMEQKQIGSRQESGDKEKGSGHQHVPLYTATIRYAHQDFHRRWVAPETLAHIDLDSSPMGSPKETIIYPIYFNSIQTLYAQHGGYCYSLTENRISQTVLAAYRFMSYDVPPAEPKPASLSPAASPDHQESVTVGYYAKTDLYLTKETQAISYWFKMKSGAKMPLLRDSLVSVQAGRHGGLYVEGEKVPNVKIELNAWFHVALSKRNLYLNGVRIYSIASLPEMSPLGQAQEGICFSEALSAEQIRDLYFLGKDVLTREIEPFVATKEAFSSTASTIPIFNQPNWSIIESDHAEYLAMPYGQVSSPSLQCYRLNSTAITTLSKLLHEPDGIDALLSIPAQRTAEIPFAELRPKNPPLLPDSYPSDQIDYTRMSAMSAYYWELFFHAPFLIANELQTHQQFQPAERWYQYIFNPRVAHGDWQLEADDGHPEDRFWRFLGLRSWNNPALETELFAGPIAELIHDVNDPGEIYEYETDPYDPQEIASLRPIAYQKAIVMHYVDNLLQWGDKLFRENTRESIVEAEMFYVAAYDLLGNKPRDLGPQPLPVPTDYEHIDPSPFRARATPPAHLRPPGQNPDGSNKGPQWQPCPSIHNYGLMFDGKKTLIDCGPNTAIKGHQARTIELWALIDPQAQAGSAFFDAGASDSWGSGFGLRLDQDGSHHQPKLRVDCWEDVLHVAPGKNLVGEWHHYAVTYDGDKTVTFFLDGETHPDWSRTSPSRLDTGKANIILGRWTAKSNVYFKGRIAEVRVWTMARQGKDIKATMGLRLLGPQAGLVDAWPIDEGKGTTIHNLIGKQNGKLTKGDGKWLTAKDGAPALQLSTLPSFEKASKVLKFDGTDDLIDCGPNTQVMGLQPRTIELWARVDSQAKKEGQREGGFFDAGTLDSDGAGFALALNNNFSSTKQQLYVHCRGDKYVFGVNRGNKNKNLIGEWHHYALTYDGHKTITFFLDGETKDGKDGWKHTLPSPLETGKANILLGKLRANGGHLFRGEIAEVQIWKMARSQEAIRRDMYSRPSANDGGLVGYWPLRQGSGDVVYNQVAGPYFLIPRNEQFLGYWDTVRQRLYNIRHGLDIDGKLDQLPLFQPAINPMELVSAVASGEGLEDAIAALNTVIPYYRFSTMIGKAKAVTATVIELGHSLLSALEKKDGEALATLYQSHQQHILELTKNSKRDQLSAAEQNILALEAGLEGAQHRQQHYVELISDGLSAGEDIQIALSGGAILAKALSEPVFLGSILGYSLPTIFGFSDGGMKPGDAIKAGAEVAQTLGQMLEQGAGIAGTIASYKRRAQDWRLQETIAQDDIAQIQLQILAAQYQHSLAQQEITLLEKNIDQEKSVADFYQKKFTNGQLYQWYIGKVATLYFQAYQLAHEIAIQAENAWKFEHIGRVDTGASTAFIKPGYWNSLYQGLLAGEALQLDLQRMEKAFTDQNERRLEITKTISLAQLDPGALFQLKQSGRCVFDLMEKDFDFDFPGHYCRKITTLSVSIPTVIGPYQNIHATLTQLTNKIVTSDDAAGLEAVKYLLRSKGGSATRALKVDVRPNQQVALSQGVDDTGLFTLDFNDERYLPFEGTGAVSSWSLEMPKEDNAFDFDHMTDVLIQLKYTALAGSAAFKSMVKSARGSFHGSRLISLAGSSGWQRFKDQSKSTPLDIKVDPKKLRANMSSYQVAGLTLYADRDGTKAMPKLELEVPIKGRRSATVAFSPWHHGMAQGTANLPSTFPLQLDASSSTPWKLSLQGILPRGVKSLLLVIDFTANP